MKLLCKYATHSTANCIMSSCHLTISLKGRPPPLFQQPNSTPTWVSQFYFGFFRYMFQTKNSGDNWHTSLGEMAFTPPLTKGIEALKEIQSTVGDPWRDLIVSSSTTVLWTKGCYFLHTGSPTPLLAHYCWTVPQKYDAAMTVKFQINDVGRESINLTSFLCLTASVPNIFVLTVN